MRWWWWILIAILGPIIWVVVVVAIDAAFTLYFYGAEEGYVEDLAGHRHNLSRWITTGTVVIWVLCIAVPLVRKALRGAKKAPGRSRHPRAG